MALILLSLPCFADSISISTTPVSAYDRAVLTVNTSTWTGSIPISVTWSGSPTSIEAEVTLTDDSTVITSWTTLIVSPSGTSGTGTLTGVPVSTYGGNPCWYHVHVRFGNDPSTIAHGINRIAIGLHIDWLGQSNAENMFLFATGGTTASPYAIKYNNHFVGYGSDAGTTGWQTATGDGCLTMMNALITYYHMPVCCLTYAIGATSMQGGWANNGSYEGNTNYLSGVSEAGSPNVIIVWQGENDAVFGYASSWASNCSSWLTWLRGQLGNLTLPVIITQIGRTQEPYSDENWFAEQFAIANYTTTDSHSYFMGSVEDFAPGSGTYLNGNGGTCDAGYNHFFCAGYESAGNRYFQTIKYILGNATYYRGPYLLGFQNTSSTITKVFIAHCGGSNFTYSGSNITGFRILASGSSITISSAVQSDFQTIQITHSAASVDTIQYMYGCYPSSTGIVLDNSPMALPLESGQTTTMMDEPEITLSSISISPSNPSTPVGGAQQFTATGIYSDSSTSNITSSVTWASATTSHATITTGGLVTGVAVGTSMISATSGLITGNTTLTVTGDPNNSDTPFPWELFYPAFIRKK